MPATEELNPLGQIFEGQFKHAWALFRDGKLDDALELSARMLLEPRLNVLHRAGFHLIMAFSENNFLEHAQRAVDLYQQLPDSTEATKFRQHAQNILNLATHDAETMKANAAARESDEDVDDVGAEEAGVIVIDADVEDYIMRARQAHDAANPGEVEDYEEPSSDLSEHDDSEAEDVFRRPTQSIDLSDGGDLDEDSGPASDDEEFMAKSDTSDHED